MRITIEDGKSKDIVCSKNSIDLTNNLRMRIIKEEKWAFSKKLGQVSVLPIQLQTVKRRQMYLSQTYSIFNTFQNIEIRK